MNIWYVDCEVLPIQFILWYAMSILNTLNYIFRSRHFGQNQCQRLTKCSFKGHFHTLPEQDVSVSRHDVQNIKKIFLFSRRIHVEERLRSPSTTQVRSFQSTYSHHSWLKKKISWFLNWSFPVKQIRVTPCLILIKERFWAMDFTVTTLLVTS